MPGHSDKHSQKKMIKITALIISCFMHLKMGLI